VFRQLGVKQGGCLRGSCGATVKFTWRVADKYFWTGFSCTIRVAVSDFWSDSWMYRARGCEGVLLRNLAVQQVD